jgi:hypothetical protein
MSVKTRRWVVAAVSVLMVMAFSGLAVTQAQTTANIAKAWAQSQSHNEKIAAFAQLETMRPEYQRALVFSLTWEERMEGGRNRYIAYLAARPDLAPEKRAAVEQVIALSYTTSTKEAYEANKEYVNLVVNHCWALIGNEDAKLFAFAGGVIASKKPVSMRGFPLMVQIKQALADAITVLADNGEGGGETYTCDCGTPGGSTGLPANCPGYSSNPPAECRDHEVNGKTWCTVTTTGCGGGTNPNPCVGICLGPLAKEE